MPDNFPGLSALFINCSLTKTAAESHTAKLIHRSAEIMRAEGVEVEELHAREHTIAFGMVKDASEDGGESDDWPSIQKKVMAADILVLGSPIWLGVKSSVATLVVERLYAYSGDTNSKGQYLYYGKAAGAIVTGNEDGVKAVAANFLYALQHIGYTIPPQADSGWLGDIGPGPSYGDVVDGQDAPAGYESTFTNKNTTIMTWNLMHMAKMLKDAGGIPEMGTKLDGWQDVTNASQFTPPSV